MNGPIYFSQGEIAKIEHCGGITSKPQDCEKKFDMYTCYTHTKMLPRKVVKKLTHISLGNFRHTPSIF